MHDVVDDALHFPFSRCLIFSEYFLAMLQLTLSSPLIRVGSPTLQTKLVTNRTVPMNNMVHDPVHLVMDINIGGDGYGSLQGALEGHEFQG